MHPWIANRPQVICFDMDGTLLNSGDFGVIAITRAFASLIASGSLPGLKEPPPPAKIRAQIGKPPAVFYKELLPENLQERAHELHLETTRHEREFLTTGLGKLFEGTLDVLDTLKRAGFKLSLVSNCSQAYLDCVSETFKLMRWLDWAACVGDKSIPGRNKSNLVGLGLRELGVTRGIMVGDRVHDAEAAHANGLWFIGCTYGYGERAEFESAQALIDDIRELPGLLGL
jgi:phosphoglycolate phosphatase-like HAD superfamily hydrolase